MNLFYQPDITEGILHLDHDESRHCIKVLRKRAGDDINITDGKGTLYHAKITKADPAACSFEIIQRIDEPTKNHFIHVAISPTKNADRIEWFVEKAVEIGIDKVTLLGCDHTERSYIKTERIEKVAVSAMKQSLKTTLPEIQSLTSFSQVISKDKSKEKFIACVDQSNPHHLKDLVSQGSSYIVLIGPEGDFTPEELNAALTHGFKKVSLGNSRLRTETAGLAACHILNLLNA